ncbi:TPA: hypothetical protein OTY32_005976 [Pseudomonas aeruginosa]|nr:hypothetical protein [Pseudomonas aeruginosa]
MDEEAAFYWPGGDKLSLINLKRDVGYARQRIADDIVGGVRFESWKKSWAAQPNPIATHSTGQERTYDPFLLGAKQLGCFESILDSLKSQRLGRDRPRVAAGQVTQSITDFPPVSFSHSHMQAKSGIVGVRFSPPPPRTDQTEKHDT